MISVTVVNSAVWLAVAFIFQVNCEVVERSYLFYFLMADALFLKLGK